MPWLPQNWNDALSLVIVLGAGAALVFAPLDGEVKGGFLTIITLIAQFYFRRAKGSHSDSDSGG